MSQLDPGKVKIKQARNPGGREADSEFRSRERYLTLLNDMTQAILRANDFDTTLGTLAVDMAKLIDADDCYITRWNEEKQLTIPAVTSAKLDKPYSSIQSNPDELSMTKSVLNARRVLVAEDVFNSPYISRTIAEEYPARSVLGVPLIAGEYKLGAAIIAFNTPHQFTPA